MSGSGDKRPRSDAEEEPREQKRRRTEEEERERETLLALVQGRSYNVLLPELHRIIHTKLPLYSILDVMETQRAFWEPTFQAAFWHELCSLEYRSPHTGRPYRFLTNAEKLFTVWTTRQNMAPDEAAAFSARYWRGAYTNGSLAIRAVLIILQYMTNVAVTQTWEQTRLLLPQHDPILNRALARDDIGWSPATYANRSNFPVTLPPGRIISSQNPRGYNVESAQHSTARNNWLAIADETRRDAARGPYLSGRVDPTDPGTRSIFDRDEFDDKSEQVVLLTQGAQFSRLFPLDGRLTNLRVDSREPLPRLFSMYWRERVTAPKKSASTIVTIIQNPSAGDQVTFAFLAQRCTHGLGLTLDQTRLMPGVTLIPLVGTVGPAGHQVTFKLAERPVMTGIVMFGQEIKLYGDARDAAQIQVWRALFLTSIDLDALIDWLCRQSGHQSLGGLLTLQGELNEAWFMDELERSLGPVSFKLARRLISHSTAWRLAHPIVNGVQQVRQDLQRDLYWRISRLNMMELAIWDYDALIVDMQSNGIDNPVAVLVADIEQSSGNSYRVHFTSPAAAGGLNSATRADYNKVAK